MTCRRRVTEEAVGCTARSMRQLFRTVKQAVRSLNSAPACFQPLSARSRAEERE